MGFPCEHESACPSKRWASLVINALVWQATPSPHRPSVTVDSALDLEMSALGQKRTFNRDQQMSALRQKRTLLCGGTSPLTVCEGIMLVCRNVGSFCYQGFGKFLIIAEP